MSPTMTAPEIAKPVKEGRAKLLKHVKGEIASLKTELATLEDTCKALEGRNGPATRTRGGNGARTTTRRRTRTRRGAAPGPSALATFMAPGKRYTSTGLAQMCGMSPNTTLRRLKALEKTGGIKRSGTGPDTRWMLA